MQRKRQDAARIGQSPPGPVAPVAGTSAADAFQRLGALLQDAARMGGSDGADLLDAVEAALTLIERRIAEQEALNDALAALAARSVAVRPRDARRGHSLPRPRALASDQRSSARTTPSRRA